jgi:hypothetical protein
MGFNFKLFKIFTLAFLLNFLWESLHAFVLYESHDLIASSYVPLMIYVSFWDAVMIFVSFIFVGFIYGNNWDFKNKGYWLFISITLLFAVFIEVRAMIQERWEYSSFMPIIFGIGLSPFFQLTITGLLTLLLIRK